MTSNAAAGRVRPPDLPSIAFQALAEAFWDDRGVPIPFSIREKGGTQDDPFDEHVMEILKTALPDDVRVIRPKDARPKIRGSLITPDAVVARPEEYDLLIRGGEEYDTRAIFGLEVKKLNLDKDRKAARGAGMDYNSTPPCATVRVYSALGSEIIIPAFYLFVTLENGEQSGTFIPDSLALVAGSALNKNVELYDAITGTRTKEIGLGTYGDGMNRNRPMMVFANPLGWTWMQGAATLISEQSLLADEHPFTLVREITRTVEKSDIDEKFYCYRLRKMGYEVEDPVRDPFPTPKSRSEQTSRRGKFVVDMTWQLKID
ncbi:hypothetical protein AB0K16_59825 [Nonomuraea jabiensis]|uniref:hypothetical protein n=1 Tax=Nonomuraea jabiensis TaxID=882448 RepID=UPI00343DB4C3